MISWHECRLDSHINPSIAFLAAGSPSIRRICRETSISPRFFLRTHTKPMYGWQDALSKYSSIALSARFFGQFSVGISSTTHIQGKPPKSLRLLLVDPITTFIHIIIVYMAQTKISQSTSSDYELQKSAAAPSCYRKSMQIYQIFFLLYVPN